MSLRPIVYYGSVINPVSLTLFKALPACLLAVGGDGNIAWVDEDVPASGIQEVLAAHGFEDVEVVCLRDGEFIMPGFVDTHTHGPQVPNMGSGQQYELLEWLEKITFPMESRFSDPAFAHATYSSVVRRMIDAGTTTCCYYGTLHVEGTKILADIVHRQGQRAFVGKCNMDRHAPSHYVEDSAEASIVATKSLVSHIDKLGSPDTRLVHPILTPRFAITCSDDLLASLGEMAAADPTLRIQTHVSENPAEVVFAKALFPERPSYTHVYDHFGLLRNNTILAHAIHLEDEEIHLIAEKHAGISHCPTSNFNLNSGIAPVGVYLDHGIKVGLGTDVSGGYSPSILNAIQNCSIASKVLAMQSRADPGEEGFTNKQLSVATLLYLATEGGARVCSLDNIGTLDAGKSFDALIVNPSWSSSSSAETTGILPGFISKVD
ncbi:unnamed protein product [Mycena citricolor]|uniref:Guanine deaminase n=1 Tax=Mycena citricolor TaxID=2018698 RepID=A0AAD2Q554_9AGAR|nr:unnamed protein product [Mycena citricolor]